MQLELRLGTANRTDLMTANATWNLSRRILEHIAAVTENKTSIPFVQPNLEDPVPLLQLSALSSAAGLLIPCSDY